MNLLKAQALLAVATIMGACSTADDIPKVARTSIDVLATVSSAPTTRTADLVYAPKGGTLHLYHANVGNAADASFVCDSKQWTTASPLYWDDLPMPANGVYPFFAVAPGIPASASASRSDQSIESAYVTSDQLVAYTATSDVDAALMVTFKHVLSQLKVSISAAVSSDSPDYLNPASATLSIGGVRTAYTLSYAGATTAVPAVARVAKDSLAASALKPFAKAGTFFAVAPAQTFAAGALTLSFTVNGAPYNWSNSKAITTQASKNTEINLKVKKSGISLAANGITLTDWDTDSKPTDDDIELEE